MPKSNTINLKEEHLEYWFGATGFYLPRTEDELKCFDKIYSEYEFKLTGDEISFESVWNRRKTKAKIRDIDAQQSPKLKMAARGLKGIPEDIRKKMISNHKKHE